MQDLPHNGNIRAGKHVVYWRTRHCLQLVHGLSHTRTVIEQRLVALGVLRDHVVVSAIELDQQLLRHVAYAHLGLLHRFSGAVG